MNLLRRLLLLFLLAALCPLAGSTTMTAQGTNGQQPSQAEDARSKDEAALLQKKAAEAQARIRGNDGDRDQLKRAIKLNEAALAKEILLRNGFTEKDLENTKIILRTGGGKGGEDQIEISATCCDPRAITIQRTLEHFTK